MPVALPSHIKPKMHHVALMDDVLLPLEPQPPRLLSPRLAAPRDVIGKRNHLSPNKPMLKIRMNNPRRLRRSRPLAHRPSAHLLGTRGEVSEQPEQRISPADHPIEPWLLQPQLLEKLGAIGFLELR